MMPSGSFTRYYTGRNCQADKKQQQKKNTSSLLGPHYSDYKLGGNFSEPHGRVSDFDSSSYCSAGSVSPRAPSG